MKRTGANCCRERRWQTVRQAKTRLTDCSAEQMIKRTQIIRAQDPREILTAARVSVEQIRLGLHNSHIKYTCVIHLEILLCFKINATLVNSGTATVGRST